MSFDKLNFEAEKLDQSPMENAQTAPQESTQVQGQNNPAATPPSTSVGPSYEPWQLRTQFRSGVTFYNNFFSLHRDPKGEIVFQNGPIFLFSNRSSSFRFNIDYEPTYQAYYRNYKDDSLDQSLTATYNRQFGRFYDKGSELLSYSSETQTVENAVRTKVLANTYGNELGYNINRYFSAAVVYQNNVYHYFNPVYSSSSYIENTVGPKIYYHLRPKLDLYVQSAYSVYRYNHDASRNADDVATTVGIEGTLSKKTFVLIQGGVQSGTQNSGQNGFVAEAMVEHRFTPKTDLTLTVNRGSQQSTSTAGAFDYWLLSSQLNYKYSPKTTISFFASWQNNSYANTTTNPLTMITIPQNTEDYINIETLTLTYDLTKKITLKGIISRQQQLSNFKQFDYEDYTFELSLIYAF